MFNPLQPFGPVTNPLVRYIARKLAPAKEEPASKPRQQPRQTPQTPRSHPGSPNATTFQNVRPLSATENQLYRAILAYPETKADPAKARQIAIEVDAASKAFGVDSKVMLAIIAHESGGFDDKAESHSGAKGLGQLTGVAIQEMRRLSMDPTYDKHYKEGEPQHYPDPEIQALVERPNMQAMFQRLGAKEDNRYNVHDNIWGSAFYARIAMDRATENKNGSVVQGENGMLGRYNGASSSERRAHSAGIAEAYKSMFGANIPTTLRPSV